MNKLPEHTNGGNVSRETGPPSASNPASLYAVIQKADTPLEDCLDRFWSTAVAMDDLPRPPVPVDQPFALLKKLGSSPFAPGGFPIIGFFATAYERVSRLARGPKESS